MHREVTLKQQGYIVSGTVRLHCWGGGEGDMEMKPVKITELTTENVLKSINDNGFGCEYYESADIVICSDYGYNLSEYLLHVEFNRDDLWTLTNHKPDYKKLAEDFEQKNAPIVDVDYMKHRIQKLSEGVYMSRLTGDYETANETEQIINDLINTIKKVENGSKRKVHS